MQCPICEEMTFREVFRGLVRAGAPGVLSKEPFTVVECTKCGVQRLSPFPPDISTFYESEQYRDTYNQSHDHSQITAMHVELRVRNVQRLNAARLFAKSVADFGCADGGMLDLVAGVASKTIGIEPAQYFHEHLRKKGHEPFSYGRDFVKTGQHVDVATSFAVIEHVPHPLEFVREMYDSLEPGGRLVLSTPNRDDILERLVPDSFRPFNYRTAHLYYFNRASLLYLLQKAGFREIEIGYLHLYDLSNLLGWYKEGKPTGVGRIALFDDEINMPLCHYLEKTGQASDIWVEAIK